MQIPIANPQQIAQYSRKELGAWGEAQGAAYLESLRYEILDRNWFHKNGELDLVAYDPGREALVAVEVKTRRSLRSGLPVEAVTAHKMHRLRVLLLAWLAEKAQRARRIEIDVLAISVQHNVLELVHYKGM